MGTGRQGEREHCCSLSATRSPFQTSSKGQPTRGWAGWHRASKGASVEESAEHSPASKVVLCSSFFYILCSSFYIVTTMSNSPFDKLKLGKCQGSLSLVFCRSGNEDEKGARTVPAPFKVSDKGPSLLEVGLPLHSKPWVLHIFLTCLAALGFLGNRNGNMDMCQTHTAEYVWLSFDWYETTIWQKA